MNGKIKSIIKNTLKEYTIEKIILFGSRARGDYDKNSDYDLYIVIKEDLDYERKVELIDLLLEKLAIEGVCADIILNTQLKMNYYKEKIGTVTRYAAEEGIEI